MHGTQRYYYSVSIIAASNVCTSATAVIAALHLATTLVVFTKPLIMLGSMLALFNIWNSILTLPLMMLIPFLRSPTPEALTHGMDTAIHLMWFLGNSKLD